MAGSEGYFTSQLLITILRRQHKYVDTSTGNRGVISRNVLIKVRHLAIDLPNGCSYSIGIAHGTLLNTLAWASSTNGKQ